MVIILRFPLCPHLGSFSLGGPHRASQTLPAAGWPGQVEGMRFAEGKTAGWRTGLQGHPPGSCTGTWRMWPKLSLLQSALVANQDMGMGEIPVGLEVAGTAQGLFLTLYL